MNRGVRTAAILVILLGAAAAVVLGVFRIGSIDIRGNERYSSEQIRDDLIYDLKTRNTLYFAWKHRSKGPAAETPYLESVQATMLSPTSVRVNVTENQLVGRVQYDEANVYFEASGIIQEITDAVYEGIPLVTGIAIEEPQLYQKLTLDNSSMLRTMLNICQLLVRSSLIPDSVNFDENGNMTLKIGGIEVRLGQDEYLEEKIANLVTIYPQIASQSGILNMEGFTGKNEAITFKTVEQIAAEEAGETEQEASGGEDTPDGALAGEGAGDGSGGDGGAESSGEGGGEESVPEEDLSSSPGFMVFDSSGTLRYDAHVVGGQVVDSYGNPIDGCYVNEDGYCVDAYWNVIDPATGTLAQ